MGPKMLASGQGIDAGELRPTLLQPCRITAAANGSGYLDELQGTEGWPWSPAMPRPQLMSLRSFPVLFPTFFVIAYVSPKVRCGKARHFGSVSRYFGETRK